MRKVATEAERGGGLVKKMQLTEEQVRKKEK